jgi:hypothetical protein
MYILSEYASSYTDNKVEMLTIAEKNDIINKS